MATKANFTAYHNYVTDSLHQWEINQVLTIQGLNLATAPEVHFSNKNMDRAIVRQATMENHVVTVNIPNTLLQHPLRIYAHIGIYEGETFKVVELVEIPVIPRVRPCDYQFEDTDGEIYSYNRLENMIENITETWYAMNAQQVQATVTSWLDAHPEATTTVQDGALTAVKFTNELKLQTIKDYVTPEMFGANGDGVTDDTVAVQTAIDEGFTQKKVVYLCGKYKITSSLRVKGVDVTAETAGAEIIGNGYAHLIAGTSLTSVVVLTPNANGKTYGVKIANLILDGNNIAENGIFSEYPTSECVFEHLTINECTNGVHITNNCYLNNFRAVRAYHCTTYGILFENGNNTSNVFEKCYVDTCANAYKVNGQYCSMISCCADNITSVVFELNSFTGALIGCGTEATQFQTMLKAYTNSNIVIMGGMYFGNAALSGYYFDIGGGCRVGVYNCTINYAEEASSGALCSLGTNAHLTLKDTYLSKPFNGNNSLTNTSHLYANTSICELTVSVTLDDNNEAVLPLSPTTFHILRIVSTNRSGWLFTPIVTEPDVYKVKVTTPSSYLPNISDKNFTLSIKYIDERVL